jgi:hypothetical protein
VNEPEEFDGKMAAIGLLKRVRGKIKFYQDVYNANDMPYTYRSPSEQELELYVRKLARNYKKKPPKKP